MNDNVIPMFTDTDPEYPGLAVIDVPTDTKDFASPDGRYFVDHEGFVALVHEAIHLATDDLNAEVQDATEAQAVITGSLFAHMVLMNLTEALESLTLSIAFGLPSAEDHDEPSSDPED